MNQDSALFDPNPLYSRLRSLDDSYEIPSRLDFVLGSSTECPVLSSSSLNENILSYHIGLVTSIDSLMMSSRPLLPQDGYPLEGYQAFYWTLAQSSIYPLDKRRRTIPCPPSRASSTSCPIPFSSYYYADMKNNIATLLPIELWRLILFEAVASSLLPFDDPNRTRLRVGVVDCLDLFDQSCDSHRDYRRHQSMLTNLRLVCRAWATTLDGYRNLCSFTDLGRVFLPKKSLNVLLRTERVHVRSSDDIYCRACDVCPHRQTRRFKSGFRSPAFNISAASQRVALGLNSPELSKEDRRWHKNPFLKTMLNPHVKIMILDAYDRSINDALTGATQLLGLAIRDASQFPWKIQLSGPILPHLTHLYINIITLEVLNLFPPVFRLSNLRYLSLGCALWPRGDSGEILSSLNWSLPNLNSLIILGSIHERVGEHFCNFLRNSGASASITELAIAGSVWSGIREYYMLKTGESVWEWFPNLCVYGTDLYVLMDDSLILPPVVGTTSPRLPLTLVITYPEYFEERELKKRTKLLTRRILHWRVHKVVIAATWDYLQTCWLPTGPYGGRNLSGPRSIKFILEAILEAGVLLCDKRGSIIQSAEAKPLWDALCKAERD
ncbi:12172_t:CDS:2, partial [Acaulospora colombiana]